METWHSKGWEKGLRAGREKMRHEPHIRLQLYQKNWEKLMEECSQLGDACPRDFGGEVALRKVAGGI